MAEVEKYEPPKPSKGDVAHTVVKAAVSSVPVVGGAAAEIFALVIAPPLQKRQAEWMKGMAEGLRGMEGKVEGFNIENLKDNPQFVSAVLNATQAAIRTHQTEKIEQLRNAVLNVAKGSGLTEDQEALFLSLIDRYAPWHVKILRLFQDPLRLGAEKGLRPENYYMGSRTTLLEAYYPELRGQGAFYNRIAADLVADGMLGGDLTGMVTAHGMFQKLTTEWGDRFLTFITSPL